MRADQLSHIAKPGEELWVYSMGKRFRVWAITTTEDATNRYMEAHDNAALIACFGPFCIVANKYEGRIS